MTVSFGYMIFYVPDVPSALAFYKNGLGLEQRMLTPEADYGELETGGTTLAFVSHQLADSNLAAVGGFTPLAAVDHGQAPVGAVPTLLTDDVTATVNTAVAAGARLYLEATEKPWGQIVAYLIDPSGILIEVATPVKAG